MATNSHFSLDFQFDAPTRKLAASQLTIVFLRSRYFITIMIALLALLAIFTLIAYLDYTYLPDALIATSPVLFAIALVPVMVYLIMLFGMTKLAQKFPDQHYEFFENYLLHRTQGAEGKLEYAVFDKLVAAKNCYFLKLGRQHIFLPAQQVSPELAEFLASKLNTGQSSKKA